MNSEAWASATIFAAIGAAYWMYSRFSTEGRLIRLTDRQGLANAMNLVAAAFAVGRGTGEDRFYAAVLANIRQIRPDAVDRWHKLSALEQDALGRMAIELLGPDGVHRWIERGAEKTRELISDAFAEARASLSVSLSDGEG